MAQLASDIEIDKVLRAVAAVHGSVHVAAFSDNLIFLLEDAGWLGSVKAALTNATTKQFGSDVTTALVPRMRCDKPTSFVFCRRRYCWKKGKLNKSLPDGWIDEFSIRLMERMRDAYHAASSAELDRCEQSIRGFIRQHHDIIAAENEGIELLVSAKEYRKLLPKKA